MAAKAICKINIGVINQTIYIENEKNKGKKILEDYSITLQNLPEFLANLNDVDKIYISGVSKDFGHLIEEKTRTIQYKKYNKDTKLFYYI